MRTGTETIIALATPPGVGALALIRLSGGEVREMTERLLEKKIKWVPRRAFLLKLRDGGEELDDCVAIYWQAPHSYTGEDTLELSVHGNPKIVERVLKAYLRQGARLALPGEFTRRALEAGKLDLTQVEGLGDLFYASTERELANARALMRGDLSGKVREAREMLINVLAQIEAYIDFPEEDIDAPTYDLLQDRVRLVRDSFTKLASTASLGKIVRDGVTTSIIGKPNVGKSSLFNLLLQEQRAITSPRPGTTRDLIDAECIVGGIRLRLFDTAGLRATQDEVEAQGMEKTRQAWDRSQLILHVVAADEAPHEDARAIAGLCLRPDQKLLKVINKSDLTWHPDRKPQLDDLIISARTGEGIDALEQKIKDLFMASHAEECASLCLLNARQSACLERATQALDCSLSGLANSIEPEIVAQDLRAALAEIDELLGVTDHEEILDKIFTQFCIGK